MKIADTQNNKKNKIKCKKTRNVAKGGGNIEGQGEKWVSIKKCKEGDTNEQKIMTDGR